MLILSGAQGVGFQPTPPARTETRRQIVGYRDMDISTHSAREDGDYQQ